jgi:PD-(D/E)XK endonuclease
MTNCKRRGEWAELQFMARAAKHGLRITFPWGEMARYDVVVESGGTFVRVQVKSTAYKRPEGCYICGAHPSARSEPYKRGDFDFLAAYVIPEDLWYIIPAKLIVNGKKTAIMLFTNTTASRWAPYKEAWDLLRNHRRRTTPKRGPDQSEEIVPNSDAVI